MQSMGFYFRSERTHEGLKLRVLERHYRQSVTVRDGCDGIFDSGRRYQNNRHCCHIPSRKGWME